MYGSRALPWMLPIFLFLTSTSSGAEVPAACRAEVDANLSSEVLVAKEGLAFGVFASSQSSNMELHPIIDDSCRKWPVDGKGTLKDRLRDGFPLLLKQVSNCAKAYGLPYLSESQEVLKNLIISCQDSSGGQIASSDNRGSYDFFKAPFTSLQPGYDKKYKVVINTKNSNLYVTDYTSEIGRSDSNLSATMLHEALHFGSNNNRMWHERSEPRSQSEKSLFSDRIYLTQGLCFPEGLVGRKLSSFSGQKPGEFHESCLAAFTNVDSEISDNSRGESFFRSVGAWYGPPRKAIPFKVGDASAFCQRIEQGLTYLSTYQKEVAKRAEKGRNLREYLVKRQPANLDNVEFRSLLAEMAEDMGRLEPSAQAADQENSMAIYTGVIRRWTDRKQLVCSSPKPWAMGLCELWDMAIVAHFKTLVPLTESADLKYRVLLNPER